MFSNYFKFDGSFGDTFQVCKRFATKRRIGETVSGCDSCGFLNNEIFYGKGRKLTIIGNGGILEMEIDSSVRQCLKTDDGIIVVLNNIIEIKGMIEGKLDSFFECIATDGLNIFVGSSNGIFSLNKSNCELNLIRKGHYYSIQIDKERMKIFGLKKQSVDIFSVNDISIQYENTVLFPQIVLSINVASFPFLFGITLDSGERLIYSDAKQEPLKLDSLVEYPNSSWCFGTHSVQYNVENDIYRVVIGRLIRKDNKLIEEIDNSIDINQPIDIQSEIKKSFIGNEVILKIVTTNEVLKLNWISPSPFILINNYLNYVSIEQPIVPQVVNFLNQLDIINERVMEIIFHNIPNIQLTILQMMNKSSGELQKIEGIINCVTRAMKLSNPPHFDKFHGEEEKTFWSKRYECFMNLDQIYKSIILIRIYSSIQFSYQFPLSLLTQTFEAFASNKAIIVNIQQINNDIIHKTKNYSLIVDFNCCGEYFEIQKCVREEIEEIVNSKNKISGCFKLMKIDLSIARMVVDVMLDLNNFVDCETCITKMGNAKLNEYYKSRCEAIQKMKKENQISCAEGMVSEETMVEMLKKKIKIVGCEDTKIPMIEREKKLFDSLFELYYFHTNPHFTELRNEVLQIGERILIQKWLISQNVLPKESESVLLPMYHLQPIIQRENRLIKTKNKKEE